MVDAAFRHIGDQADEEGQPLAAGRSLIAVVGIDAYTHHLTLTNAVSDAEAVLGLFKRCGFEELPGAASLFDEHATLGALTSLVRDQLPNELQPDDSLVLFFAGHGTTVSREVPDPQDAGKTVARRTGYLIPVGARERKPGDWLRLDAFLEDIAMLPARHVLVILDACKSGFALSEKFKFRGDGQAEGTIAELSGRVSRRVITSAMHDQKAMDGGGSGNSLFTESLVDAVENLQADWDGDGYVTTTDLFTFVRQQVSDTAAQVHHVRQTPDYGQLPGDGSGELVLSLRGDTYNRLRAAETLEIADQIYDLGWLSGDAKRFASAVRHYKAAHDLAMLGKMVLPAARLGLGKALLAADRAEEAAAELADLVKDGGDASPAEAQFYLGLAHAKRGESAQAAEALRAWLARSPDSVDAAWVGAYVDWLAQAAHPAAGRKLALLVGINQYHLAHLSPLSGCVNDVTKLMQPALLAHGGFREEDMAVLTDSQATYTRFVQEMEKLRGATLADAVVVYFSGHSIPPSSLSEGPRGYFNDVYLILHDTHDEPGRLTDGITADELHHLMQEI
ncbi:MAG: caspase family protein, partial [Anaerolineae bacterium]